MPLSQFFEALWWHQIQSFHFQNDQISRLRFFVLFSVKTQILHDLQIVSFCFDLRLTLRPNFFRDKLVKKQYSLSFSGSVAFSIKKSLREKYRKGKRESQTESESQWFPPAPVSLVSPVAHLTHSLCWAMGKSDWAHYPLLRTDSGSARREREGLFGGSLWMETIIRVVTIRNVWPSAKALPI